MSAAQQALADTIRSFEPFGAQLDALARQEGEQQAAEDRIERLEVDMTADEQRHMQLFFVWLDNHFNDDRAGYYGYMWRLYTGKLTAGEVLGMRGQFDDWLRAEAEQRAAEIDEDAEADYLAQKRGIAL